MYIIAMSVAIYIAQSVTRWTSTGKLCLYLVVCISLLHSCLCVDVMMMSSA